jgi:CxxC motif-containing protein (DUF1111 family)
MRISFLGWSMAGVNAATTSTRSHCHSSGRSFLHPALAFATVFLILVGTLHAQTDPGPRVFPGAVGVACNTSTPCPKDYVCTNPTPTSGVCIFSPGGNATRLTLNGFTDMQKFWGGGQNIFKQAFAVSGSQNATLPGVNGPAFNGNGLGPTFNGNSCAMCHFQPTLGGTSPSGGALSTFTNPEVSVASLNGATNAIPSFITANGPVREARFIFNSNHQLDGGVHELFTIVGRSDAPSNCTNSVLPQPDFATQLAKNNVIFRIPTPLFGLGLVENTPDATLQANLSASQGADAKLGIVGRFNTSGNDGTITRFGWKAQNKSLDMFAGEAMNVELGVSNELFPNERSAVAPCVSNSTPEDSTPATGPDAPDSSGATTGPATQMASVKENLVIFMRFNAPLTPACVPTNTSDTTTCFSTQTTPPVTVTVGSVTDGANLFSSIGCAFCHSPSMTTAASQFSDLSNVNFHPYSDFALHHMGENLADGVSQGIAGPDEFRTAPLWGVGERLLFLHDGRTGDLLAAIKAHASPILGCASMTTVETFEIAGGLFAPLSPPTISCGSEANTVINSFNALTGQQQQDILNFLRSL